MPNNFMTQKEIDEATRCIAEVYNEMVKEELYSMELLNHGPKGSSNEQNVQSAPTTETKECGLELINYGNIQSHRPLVVQRMK